MPVQIIHTQLDHLPIIAKHLKAMDAELMKLREGQDYSWGDGMWADVPEVIVKTSGDGMILGRFVLNDVGGYDFTQSEGA